MFQIFKNYFFKYKFQLLIGVMSAFLAHLFVLVNILHNYDNVVVLPGGYGTGIVSGRWFLTILGNLVGKVWGNYNIPFFNGLITIAILLIAACLILDIFEMKTAWIGALWTSIFVCFPTVTSTLFFMYTAPYYAIAVLMAVLAVWVTEKFRYGFLVSPILQACSLGIYQAYFPMTVTLFVLILISKILEKDSALQKLIMKGFAYLGNLACGMGLYFIFLKISLHYYGKELGTYQGIDSMGKLNLSELPFLLRKTFVQILKIPVKDYYGMTSTGILKCGIVFLGIFSIAAILFILKNHRAKPMIYLGMFGLCIIFLVAVNCIQIMCPDSSIYTLMVYAAVFIYLAPLLLLEKLLKEKPQTVHGILQLGGVLKLQSVLFTE